MRYTLEHWSQLIVWRRAIHPGTLLTANSVETCCGLQSHYFGEKRPAPPLVSRGSSLANPIPFYCAHHFQYQHLKGGSVLQNGMGLACHAVDSPPSKAVPPDCPQQNNRSPRTKYRSHTCSPPAADGPPRLWPFHNCLCHSACIWRTAWTLPVRSKQGKATSA